jgi:hypothetical protein
MATKIIAPRRIKKDTVNSALESIKGNVKDTYQYFTDNYQRFNYYRKFAFQTSWSASEISVLQELGKPVLEFNIIEAHLSRQCGEFADQEPSFMCSLADDAKNVDPRLPEFIESHMRAIMFNSNIDNMEYEVFRDILSGGFSAMEVYTEYASPMSFNQNIRIKRVFDPTLVGFDKMAKESHKGDGNFCFQLYPMTVEDFEDQFGTEYSKDFKFSRGNLEGFHWSYATDNNEIVLVADYYQKKKKKMNIVQLRTGEVMTTEDYEKLIGDWNTKFITQPPAVVGKSRKSDMTVICRSKIMENAVLEYVETDYQYLPLVFVDGNSVMIRDYTQGSAKQITRPYIYHAEGIQKLKNFAGVTLANDIENLVQHKWMVQKEAIPAEYKEAYINPQKAQTMIYNGFKADDQSIALQPPQPVARVPIPPEITNAFSMSEQTLQSILGSYDSALGINGNQLSGKAIQNGAMQSNSAAKPYRVGYIRALNQIGRIIVDLMPKYYVGERNIPVRGLRGDMKHENVNSYGSISTKYTPDSINLKVEAGVNFEMQKSVSLQMLTQLMQTSQTFAAFMATEPGIQTLLDNIDIRNVDLLKKQVGDFSKQMAQQQKQQQQMQMQMNPVAVKYAELKQEAQQNRIDNLIEAARVENETEDTTTRRIAALIKSGEAVSDKELEQARINAENDRTAADMVMQTMDMKHNHFMDAASLHSENARHQQTLDYKE